MIKEPVLNKTHQIIQLNHQDLVKGALNLKKEKNNFILKRKLIPNLLKNLKLKL
jgi:hypothetical protein